MLLLDKKLREKAILVMGFALFVIICLGIMAHYSNGIDQKYEIYREDNNLGSRTKEINQKLINAGIGNPKERFVEPLVLPIQTATKFLKNYNLIEKINYNSTVEVATIILRDNTAIETKVINNNDFTENFKNEAQKRNILMDYKTLKPTELLYSKPSNMGMAIFLILIVTILYVKIFEMILKEPEKMRATFSKIKINNFFTEQYNHKATYAFLIISVIGIFSNIMMKGNSIFTSKSFVFLYLFFFTISTLYFIMYKRFFSLIDNKREEAKESINSRVKKKLNEENKHNGVGLMDMEVINENICDDDWNEEDNETSVVFEDLAGVDEAVEDLKDMIDFFLRKEKYSKRNILIPQGGIMTGPPGTGKTTLAKAFANHSKSPFIYINGSKFTEVFVGVGAKRIRQLFEVARSLPRCVIFIDEIDAIGKKRSNSPTGGSDEREGTLNQLLSELDGFANNDNIIVLAATNRLDLLDDALIRPGRLTKEIPVNLPDYNAREEILNLYFDKLPVGHLARTSSLAHMTSGFSGAELENLVNEANLISFKRNHDIITEKDIVQAFQNIVAGKQKKNTKNNESEELVAYHEAGHALLYYLTKHIVSVISVIPTTKGAGGFVIPKGSANKGLKTKKDFLNQIKVSLAGRIAEEIKYGEENITVGASNDLEKVTSNIRQMTMRYGMFKEVSLFVSKDAETFNLLGPEAKSKIHNFMEEKLSEISNETKDILELYTFVLDDIKSEVLKEKILFEDEINTLIEESIKKHNLPNSIYELKKSIKNNSFDIEAEKEKLAIAYSKEK